MYVIGLGSVAGSEIEGIAEGFDEQAEVVLEGQAREQVGANTAGVIAGDPVNDEFERIGLGGIDFMEQVFGGCNLNVSRLGRGKAQLARELGDLVDAIAGHAASMPSSWAEGQAKSTRRQYCGKSLAIRGFRNGWVIVAN